ncbi:Glycosyl transferase family 1 [Hyphomicrobiales bacterium]|nr:Glycosyl transferase family 1 [Hyphomicrobiales bacterium]CAH1699171.1 Glycosyl transferase family 1 [Hyphomicrobiales bacterium]CAI0342957.1 Glycosyl transferase family 1 [Hyphomicrobiales bacterium]
MNDTVLFISHEASRTGAPIILLNFLRWLRRNEPIPFRIVTGSTGGLSEDFAAVGRVDPVDPDGPRWYRALRHLNLHGYWRSSHLDRLRRELSKESFCLVYVNSIAGGRLLDLLPIGDCRVICHVHELAGAIRAVGLDNLAALERHHARYIAVSHAVKECLVKEFGVSPDRIEVIHGFIPHSSDDVPSLEEARQMLARELNIPVYAKVVCGCGSIEARKGTDLFIEIARQVCGASSGDIRFVWIGGAAEEAEAMRRVLDNEGLGGRVHFVGSKADAAVYFAAADVFLLTSREDPFPLVVMEAARCGAPIVCFSDGGGAPEFVGDDAGFCVPDFDVSAMSRRVLELTSSRSLRDRMGGAAKRKAETNHNIEQGASRIASRIREVIRGDGAARVEAGSPRSEKVPGEGRGEPLVPSPNGATTAQ